MVNASSGEKTPSAQAARVAGFRRKHHVQPARELALEHGERLV